jgi:hypothetical protein
MAQSSGCRSRSSPGGITVALLGLALSVPCAGCAFSEVTVVPPAASAAGTDPSAGRGREIVLAMPLEDQRMDRTRCGTQKNGWNMETAHVVCALPPGHWVAQALAQGLAASGFLVTTAPSDSMSSVRVSGQVMQFFIEPKLGFLTFTPEADISVHLAVSSPSGLLAERTFYFKADEVSVVGTEDNFQAAADAATQKAVHDMVQAIVSLLDRYPNLGAPRTNPVAVSLLTEGEGH